jgi:histidinol-phosphate aminotransferase
MSNVNYGLRFESSGDSISAEPKLREVSDRSPVVPSSSVQELTPYEAVTSQAAIRAKPDGETVFKLDWNESTVPASPEVREAIAAHIAGDRGLNWYPQLGSEELIEALTDYTGLESENLLVTNGSDDALHLICDTFLDPGDHVVAPAPTYNHFITFAQSCGADIEKPIGESPFEKSIDAIRDSLRPSTRILYLVSPNNPTGVIYPPEDVAELCRDHPETLILLDEAYYEFAKVTGVDLVEEHPNIVVTRTFSKAFGLAGLRVGYLSGHPELVDALSRIYNPKSVNTLGQVGAKAALEDLEYLEEYLSEVEAAKGVLADYLDTTPVEYHMTPANFVVVRVPQLQETLDALEQRGIYVRDRSDYPGLDNCLRMTIGTVDQTRKVIDLISGVF